MLFSEDKMGLDRAGTITLQGKEIEVTYREMRQANLRFYEENPRIYSFIYKNEEFTNSTLKSCTTSKF